MLRSVTTCFEAQTQANKLPLVSLLLDTVGCLRRCDARVYKGTMTHRDFHHHAACVSSTVVCAPEPPVSVLFVWVRLGTSLPRSQAASTIPRWSGGRKALLLRPREKDVGLPSSYPGSVPLSHSLSLAGTIRCSRRWAPRNHTCQARFGLFSYHVLVVFS